MTASRRLAAILAADVAGYSRLMRADEEGTLERLKALCSAPSKLASLTDVATGGPSATTIFDPDRVFAPCNYKRNTACIRAGQAAPISSLIVAASVVILHGCARGFEMDLAGLCVNTLIRPAERVAARHWITPKY